MLLAIDQSTRCSGWALYNDDGLVEFGIFKTPAALTGVEAAFWQVDAIEEAVALKGIKVLALEKLYIPRDDHSKSKSKRIDPNTIFLLGELRGMLLLTVRQYGCQVENIASTEVCQHIGVSPFTPRTAKKRASRQSAAMDIWQDRSKWKDIKEDAADAIAIGAVAQRRLRIASMTI